MRKSANATLDIGCRTRLLGKACCCEHDIGSFARRIEGSVDRQHSSSACEAALGQVGIGKIGERVSAKKNEYINASVGSSAKDAFRVETLGNRKRRPDFGIPLTSIVESDAPRKKTRSEAHVESATDIGTSER